jgi:cytochrome c553
MKVATGITLSLIGLLGAGAATAQDISAESRRAALHVAVTTCATCHGPAGRSISPKFPNLAGQHASYLIAQLKNFKSQSRGDPDALGYMWGMAAPLDDELMIALATYYSAQQPAKGIASNASQVALGKNIYANGITADGIPACAACHGPDAQGTDQFPRLRGLSAQYSLKQLDSFKSNLRDVATMHGVVSGLKTADMNAVASYLQSLGT